MLDQCWPIVYDAGPTLAQYWVNVLCLQERRWGPWWVVIFHPICDSQLLKVTPVWQLAYLAFISRSYSTPTFYYHIAHVSYSIHPKKTALSPMYNVSKCLKPGGVYYNVDYMIVRINYFWAFSKNVIVLTKFRVYSTLRSVIYPRRCYLKATLSSSLLLSNITCDQISAHMFSIKSIFIHPTLL